MVDPEILNLAAEKFITGAWLWNDGTRPHSDRDRCLMMAILGAAGELGKHAKAYDTVRGMARYLNMSLGDWNEAPGRNQRQVVAALRCVAALAANITTLLPPLSTARALPAARRSNGSA